MGHKLCPCEDQDCRVWFDKNDEVVQFYDYTSSIKDLKKVYSYLPPDVKIIYDSVLIYLQKQKSGWLTQWTKNELDRRTIAFYLTITAYKL